MLPLKQELQERWLLKQATDDKLFELYEKWGESLYVWMDPTADSLHLGNFVWFMHALQYMKRGNKLIFIIWWATWMIWDPWGKNSERSFLDRETLASNVVNITSQVSFLLDNITKLSGQKFEFTIKNNLDFFEWMSYLDFLRDVGKHITVNNMIKKETVKRRVESDDASISYTEFSYMLIQGYDFVQLLKQYDCKLQIAWSDQRWNVVTWIELIRKILDKEAYGATTPLILDSTWKKFWKSEWNALRLSKEKNSPYKIYNYFINTSDEDVERYLRIFCLEWIDVIERKLEEHLKDKSKRLAQQYLAYCTTELIFWTEEADKANEIRHILYSGDEKIEKITVFVGEKWHGKEFFEAVWWSLWDNMSILDALTLSGLFSSRWEAKKAIKNNAISLNESKVSNLWKEITDSDRLWWKIVLLKKWKKHYACLYRE